MKAFIVADPKNELGAQIWFQYWYLADLFLSSGPLFQVPNNFKKVQFQLPNSVRLWRQLFYFVFLIFKVEGLIAVRFFSQNYTKREFEEYHTYHTINYRIATVRYVIDLQCSKYRYRHHLITYRMVPAPRYIPYRTYSFEIQLLLQKKWFKWLRFSLKYKL